MTTEAQRLDHLVTRVDLIAGELADARSEIAELQRSRTAHDGQLAALERQDARVLVEVGGLRAEVGVLAGAVRALGETLGKISAKLASVPRGAAAGAVAGAGVPTGLLIVWEIVKALRAS